MSDNAPEIAELRTNFERKSILKAEIHRSSLEGKRIILKKRFILLREDKLVTKKRLQACNIEGGIISKFHFSKQPQRVDSNDDY
jgi:hypothetical protein